MLRAEVAAGTPIGREAKAVMEVGQRGSDDILIRMLRSRIAQPDCAAQGTLPVVDAMAEIDEVPRRLLTRLGRVASGG